MQNIEHRRMIVESVEHGPLIWPTIEENWVTRTKKYVELSDAEKIQADCDMKATNIILQGLPADIYSLVNHHRVAKDLWERVQLLMQDLHTTNFDQLHAYLEQHELHANEVHLMRERNQDPLALSKMNHQTLSVIQIAYQSPQVPTQSMNESPLAYSGLVVPVFYPGDDPIACLNKAMDFLIVGHSATSLGETRAKLFWSGYKSYATSFRETMQVDRQGLLNATNVKVKDIWLGNALSLSDQGMQHDPGVPDGQAIQTIIPNCNTPKSG
ncbi:hypothetical protein Tco_1194931 [Tanacetum coccineum]